MQLKSILFFISTLISLSRQIVDLSSLVIFSVSTDVGRENADRFGSILGGTRLYIKLTGHDNQVSSNNIVTVGPYPCEITDKGVSEIMIVCETQKATDPLKLENLDVVVQVPSKNLVSMCGVSKENCQFSYLRAYTPTIIAMIPKAQVPSEQTNFFGVFKMSNTNQIQKLKIGDHLCDRFEITRNENTSLSSEGNELITCNVAKDIEGGYYNVDLIAKWGFSRKAQGLTQVQINNQKKPFDFKVVPQIQSLNQQKGSTQGQILVITGNGFSNFPEKIQAKVGNVDCKIIESSIQQIKCELQPGAITPQKDAFTFGLGVKLSVYDYQGWVGEFAKAVWNNSIAPKLLSESVIPQPEVEGDNNKGYYFRGYFKVPMDGKYSFTCTSDGSAQFYFNTAPKSQDVATRQKVCDVGWSNLKSLFSRDLESLISQPIQLYKDNIHYFEIFDLEDAGGPAYMRYGYYINTSGKDYGNIDNLQQQVIRLNLKRAGQPKLGDLAGTFAIQVGGEALQVNCNNQQVTDIPITCDNRDDKILSALQAKLDNPYITLMNLENTQKFIVTIPYLQQPLADNFLTITHKLTDSLGNTITASSEIIQPFNKNTLVYTAMEVETLSPGLSDVPFVEVRVNDAPNICRADKNDCSYQTLDANTPQFSNASLNAAFTQLSFDFVKGGTLDIKGSELQVWIGGVLQTINASSNFSTGKIVVDINPDTPSGTFTPKIHQNGFGFAKANSNTSITLNLVVSSISPTEGSISGGTEVVIKGKYFPLNSQVQVDGSSVFIKSITSSQIVIITAAGTAGDKVLKVIFDGQNVSDNSNQKTYKYVQLSNPTITGLQTFDGQTLKSSSPVLKRKIKIIGTGFGTNMDQVQVFLDDEVNKKLQKYRLNILSITDTEIEAFLSGGEVGKYKVKVVKSEVGNSVASSNTANDFSYEILHQSTSPKTSSVQGGNIITITGTNFSTKDTDNQVFIVQGDISEICDIVGNPTTTQITCRTPALAAGTYQVEVWGKVVAKSTCVTASECQIVYSNDQTPAALSVGASLTQGTDTTENVLSPSGSQIFFFSGSNIVKQIDVVSSKFKVPNLPAGIYTVKGFVKDKGFTPGKDVKIEAKIISVDRTSGSNGGSEIKIVCSGIGAVPQIRINKQPAYILNNDQATGTLTVRTPVFTQDTTGDIEYNFDALVNDPNIDSSWVKHTTQFSSKGAGFAVVSTLQKGTDQQFDLKGTSLSNIDRVYAQLQDPTRDVIAKATLSQQSDTALKIDFVNAPAGNYIVYCVQKTTPDYATFSQASMSLISIEVTATSSTGSNIDSSIGGGAQISLTGLGFDKDATQVLVCGLQADIKKVTETSIQATTPILNSQVTQQQYQIPPSTNYIQPYSQIQSQKNPQNNQLLFDNTFNNYYSDSPSGGCFIGLDFFLQQIKATKIEFYTRTQGITAVNNFNGAKIQGSNDATTWTDILLLDSTVQMGKNTYKVTQSNSFRYFRLFDQQNSSKCQVTEMRVYGHVFAGVSASLSSTTCDIVVYSNQKQVTVANSKVVYSQSKTPVVTAIDPPYGTQKGNTQIKITGQQLSGNVEVNIDGVKCTVSANTATSIVCTTGVRPSGITDPPSFQVYVNSQLAITNGLSFFYGCLWSEMETWGGDLPPVEGDSILVPKGQTIIVDSENIPLLNTVIVEGGKLMFADKKNINFSAKHILVRHGHLMIGNEKNPIKDGKVTITMYGNMDDPQLPMTGNKGIICHQCLLEICGKKRAKTWSELSETANAGASSIYVDDPNSQIDWAVGEEIAIASTDFDHNQSEVRKIVSISGSTKKSITLDQPLKYKHYSSVETHNNLSFPMKAEVILLTRNVKIQGDPSSDQNTYGAHLMIHGQGSDGTTARILYAEFTRTGQPKIVGRYPIHFHMCGDVSNSIVQGNSVHHSYARVLTIHATHFLTVLDNVGYRAAGHNIFLEDGIETNNHIENNCIMSTIQVWTMLQTDITAASYWLTHPLNTVINNRAAGGDFYGFWYEIKEHPDGPSARSDVCPQGMSLGKFSGNIAHSYERFGLRIFKMVSLKYPCKDGKNNKKQNPYEDNPSSTTNWENFITFKNKEDGVLAEYVGDQKFTNFMVADSKQSAFNVFQANFTQKGVVLENWTIVGRSNGNAMPIDYHKNSRGIITPQSEGFSAKNIHFTNFDDGMTLFKSGSKNDNFLTQNPGGYTSYFSKVSLSPTVKTPKFVLWEKVFRDIYVDEDGSLTGKTGPVYITRTSPQLEDLSECDKSQGTKWDTGIMCSGVHVVRLNIINPEPIDTFKTAEIRLYPLDGKSKFTASTVKLENNYRQPTLNLMVDTLKNGFLAIVATNHVYNVEWSDQLNFRHILVQKSPLFQNFSPQSAQNTVILRFSYTEQRESFDVGRMIAGNVLSKYSQTASPFHENKVCNNGDWYNDQKNSAFYLCINGYQSQDTFAFDAIDINAIKCLKTCPLPPGTCEKETKTRKWSVEADWKKEDGTDPRTSDGNVLIPCPWNMVLDVPEVTVKGLLKIEGNLSVDQSAVSLKLRAKNVFINGGSFKVEGDKQGPYVNNFTLELFGEDTDKGLFLIDDKTEISTRTLGNIGTLILRGQTPQNIQTVLKKFAKAKDVTIEVENASSWKEGDIIGIAPTGFIASEYDELTIKSVSGNSITFTSPLQYDHIGAADPAISKTWGSYQQVLDMRARVVLLTRNVKVVAPSTGNLGCRVLTYNYEKIKDGSFVLPIQEQIKLRGQSIIDSVEFNRCGQWKNAYGGLDYQLLASPSTDKRNIINNSVLRNCPGTCLNIDKSSSFDIKNNVFFNARPLSLHLRGGNDYTVQNNVFISALARNFSFEIKDSSYDMIAHIYYYDSFSIDTDKILMSGNIAQGSDGPCFTFPHTVCPDVPKIDATKGIFQNQANTCEVGVIFSKNDNDKCQWSGKIGIAKAKKGLMLNPSKKSIQLENIISAESEMGVDLRFAQDSDSSYAQWKDSYVSAIAFPNCQQCYQNKTLCSNQQGIQMLLVTVGGEALPMPDPPLNKMDVVCTASSYNQAIFMNNIVFDSFKKSYTDNPNLSQCTNNVMFHTNPAASDGSAGHYLNQVTCVNCDKNALFTFTSASPGWLGWFGGCGNFLCTGPENVLVTDFTGSLSSSGNPVQYLSYKLYNHLDSMCVKNADWNGYECEGTKFVQLEWQSIAPDRTKKMHAPVILAHKDYQIKINAQKEWGWDGAEPMNTRANIFLATVLHGQQYEMTYEGGNPQDAMHQLQYRKPEAEDENIFVIIKTKFQVALSLEVVVNDQTVKSFRPDQQIDLTDKKSTCGAGIYDYENYTISFIINAQPDCRVRLRTVNLVRVSLRLTMTPKAFFDDEKSSNFSDRIASFLRISPDKIKIVGYNQSRRRNRLLQQTTGATMTIDVLSQQTGNNSIIQNEISNLQTLSKQLENGIKQGLIQMPDNYGFSSLTTQVLIAETNPDGSLKLIDPNTYGKTAPISIVNNNDNQDSGALVAAILFGILFLITLIALIVFIHKYVQATKQDNYSKVTPVNVAPSPQNQIYSNVDEKNEVKESKGFDKFGASNVQMINDKAENRISNIDLKERKAHFQN